MKVTPWSRVPEMMMVPVLVKKFHAFVEPEFHYCVHESLFLSWARLNHPMLLSSLTFIVIWRIMVV
jgi:hypothetical protein